MKKPLVCIASLILTFLIGCSNVKEKVGKENSNKPDTQGILTTPINYDFENLGLQLNGSIDNAASKVDWKWDYMNSDKGMPDSTGIDHYMNLNQPVFAFNGETTLPSLSITTDKKHIQRFSSTIIFHLENEKPESIGELLDSLTTIDLLQDEKVRQAVVEKGRYQATYDNYVETIELQISDKEYGYDRITYEIISVP